MEGKGERETGKIATATGNAANYERLPAAAAAVEAPKYQFCTPSRAQICHRRRIYVCSPESC